MVAVSHLLPLPEVACTIFLAGFQANEFLPKIL